MHPAGGGPERPQVFQFVRAPSQHNRTDSRRFLELGRSKTLQLMATHVSHMGVHDHGFNNISTYGNLWRLMREGRIPFNEREKDFYELALKVSGGGGGRRRAPAGAGAGLAVSF